MSFNLGTGSSQIKLSEQHIAPSSLLIPVFIRVENSYYLTDFVII